MVSRQGIAALLALAALPLAALGQAYEVGEYESGEGDGPPRAYEDAPPVDVSVDLSVPGAAVDFDSFQTGLAPYGEWVVSPSYGRVWRPRVAVGWRPYYDGQWTWTNEGWFWASNEPWAWATYHYGRWAYDPYLGWTWVPGYQWAPAWVTWRFSGDVVGWAPLWPGLSVYVTSYPATYAAWTFVPCARFVGYPVSTVAYPAAYVPRYYASTRPAPPRAVLGGMTAPAWGGPPARHVEARIGHPMTPARIVPVSSPRASGVARPGTIAIYRPEMRSAPPATSHPGWGSASRPGSGPPGRAPAPGAVQGSRTVPGRPGWAAPPGRGAGPAPVAPGSRYGSAPWRGYAPPSAPPRGEGAYRGPAAPPAQGWQGPRGGSPGGQRGYAPAPRGGSPGGQGGYAPAPRGGAPAGHGSAPRGGGAPPSQGGEGHRR